MTRQGHEEALESVRISFDARAETYDDSKMHRDLATAIANFLKLEGVDAVLDIATGTGLVLRALCARAHAENRALPHLTGTDISPGMLRVAAEQLPDAAWLVADAAALALPEKSTDLITCVTALHVIPDVPGMIAEWRRLLQPGGCVVTASFAQDVVLRPEHRRHPYPVDHEPYGSPSALRDTAQSHGFAITRVERWSDGTDHLLLAEWTAQQD